jgi:hypothetical protein
LGTRDDVAHYLLKLLTWNCSYMDMMGWYNLEFALTRGNVDTIHVQFVMMEEHALQH